VTIFSLTRVKRQLEETVGLIVKLCCSLMAWDCGLRYVFSVSPALQQGPGAGTRDKEDISRLEMVQRLAKDGCRLLHSPLRATERPAEVRFKLTFMHQSVHTLLLVLLLGSVFNFGLFWKLQ